MPLPKKVQVYKYVYGFMHLWSEVFIHQTGSNTLSTTTKVQYMKNEQWWFDWQVGDWLYLTEVTRDSLWDSTNRYTVLTCETLIKSLKSTFSYLRREKKPLESDTFLTKRNRKKRKGLTDCKVIFKLKGEASLTCLRVFLHHSLPELATSFSWSQG